MNKNDKVKRLEEYKQEKPIQLSFFEFLLPQEDKYSNSIELYDFIPKYFWGKTQRINGQFLLSLEREFECRGVHYKVKIRPARMEDKDGIERDYYPSQREELVEDALRKLAAQGQGIFLDDAAGVTFTIYRLQQELKDRGHSYSKEQIKDALLICAKTSIEVRTEDGSAVMVSSLFETLGLQTRDDWQDRDRKTRAFVRFNSLVTQSIKRNSFRQINYEKSMSLKSVIARQLHKRMSHHYTQASLMNSYTISLSTIIRDFGLTAYNKLANNLRDVKAALDEMKKKDVVIGYDIKKVLDSKNRNKLIDAQLTLMPSRSFVSESIEANKRKQKIELSQTSKTPDKKLFSH